MGTMAQAERETSRRAASNWQQSFPAYAGLTRTRWTTPTCVLAIATAPAAMSRALLPATCYGCLSVCRLDRAGRSGDSMSEGPQGSILTAHLHYIVTNFGHPPPPPV